MKKKLYNHIYSSLLLGIIATALLLSGCQDDGDQVGPPVVTEVRNYAASPDDTVIQTLQAGQWVVLMGKNLGNVSVVLFGSVQAKINNTLFTDHSIVIQIPSIPLQSVPRDKINEITLVNKNGAVTTFTINIIGAPIISRVRNYVDAPNDTILQSILPGQKITLVGFNLKDATKISFQGVDANLNDVVYSDSSAVVQVPSDLSGSNAALSNTISYTTAIGSGTFSIKIIGPPIITRVSYEIPNAGDSVYLYGNNFISVQDVTFAGATISDYKVSADGSSVGFIAPTLSQSGPVSITTLSGTFTTAYNVNDVTTGAISTFEWGNDFHWDWWGGASLTSGDPNSGWPPYNADFPGNTGLYLVQKNNVLDGGAGDEYSTAIRIGGVQWLPAEDVNDPAGSWALKFEVYVPNAWLGGTVSIKSANDSYRARYEPWQITPTKTASYFTNGWQTVTIPLSSFRQGDGQGTPIASISDLLGSTGKSDLILYVHNYGSSPTTTAFYAAFDNFRVVKQ
jgi:hypothetical protein